MGYHTTFNGTIKLDRPLDAQLADYIRAFSESRRIKLDPEKVDHSQEKLRIAAGLPVGIEGEFCISVGDESKHPAVINYNQHPDTQPGLWCDWTISADNKYIEWSGGEKFYEYIDWMKYIVRNFIVPFGYTADGEIEWQGEDESDFGIVGVDNNRVYSQNGFKDYGEKHYV